MLWCIASARQQEPGTVTINRIEAPTIQKAFRIHMQQPLDGPEPQPCKLRWTLYMVTRTVRARDGDWYYGGAAMEKEARAMMYMAMGAGSNPAGAVTDAK